MSGTEARPISAGLDIAREPRDVFGYIADATRLPEWQPDVRSAAFERPAAVGVGTRGHEVRHVMGADRPITWEVTHYDPDRRYELRGVDGPVRAHVTMDLSRARQGTGTHLEYGIDFEGRGIGRLMAPLARAGARKDLAVMLQRLKRRLEQDR